MNNPQAQKSCVLFADLPERDSLREKLGRMEAEHAIERCLNRMRRAVEQYHGHIVDIVGDEVTAFFEGAEDAMHAACSMQQRVEDLPPLRGIQLAIRCAFHCGDVIERQHDVYGEAADVAARLAGMAEPGQIFTCSATAAKLPEALRAATRVVDVARFGARADGLRPAEVIWRAAARPPTPGIPAVTAVLPGMVRLSLKHGAAVTVMHAANSLLTLGRNPDSDIIIADRRASRNHARIERRHDKFVLIDQSTNGTYVSIDGEYEYALKRAEAILHGHGRISFGHAFDGVSETVEFWVG